jgi:hypothetical protein
LFAVLFPLPHIDIKNAVLPWLAGRKLSVVISLRNLEEAVILIGKDIFV